MADHRPGVDTTVTVATRFKKAALAGVAVVVPLLITVYVLTAAVDILTQVLQPLVSVLNRAGFTTGRSLLIVQTGVVVLLGVLTVFVGFLATFQRGQEAISTFDILIERIPGLGGVYKSFRKMSDVLLESDTENFQSVVLVEFPHDGAYTLGFETTETPEEIEDAAREDGMRTLFLPLAPNPVMGGFLAHVPEERVRPVDMTVEEGMRTVVTTGVAITHEEEASLSQEELRRLNAVDLSPKVDPDAIGDDDEESDR
ncbi:MAG: DUF502 domain-containing protein [Halobacteriaceae archaeon]